MFLEYNLLFPLERVGVLIVCSNEVVNVMPQLLGAGETGGGERLAAENAEPDLHLIEPGGMRGRVMEVDVGMPLQPAVAFGLMGIEVVEDDMDLPVGIGGHDAVHKIEKFHSAAALIVARFDQPSGYLQGGEQGGRAVSLVVVLKASERLPVGQSQPALGSFQGL